MVFVWTPNFPISWCTYAYSAISMANATSVMTAATNDRREAASVTVTCLENARRNATNATAVADTIGWLVESATGDM